MELLTERLHLREFQADEWPAVLAYQSDPLYLRYYHWTQRTPEAVQEFVGWFLAHQVVVPRDKYQFAVTLKASGELIGNCGVRRTAPGALVADLGYELAPAHWGKGYATEAARAVLAFGFSALGVDRIESWCVAENTGSAHVLEKIGMRFEGRLRDKEYFKNRWWDQLIYAVLDTDPRE
jgi:[ribosomal protein S5]-alanine N-acetyltransferase